MDKLLELYRKFHALWIREGDMTHVDDLVTGKAELIRLSDEIHKQEKLLAIKDSKSDDDLTEDEKIERRVFNAGGRD